MQQRPAQQGGPGVCGSSKADEQARLLANGREQAQRGLHQQHSLCLQGWCCGLERCPRSGSATHTSAPWLPCKPPAPAAHTKSARRRRVGACTAGALGAHACDAQLKASPTTPAVIESLPLTVCNATASLQPEAAQLGRPGAQHLAREKTLTFLNLCRSILAASRHLRQHTVFLSCVHAARWTASSLHHGAGAVTPHTRHFGTSCGKAAGTAGAAGFCTGLGRLPERSYDGFKHTTRRGLPRAPAGRQRSTLP